jgi:hypothetical protein
MEEKHMIRCTPERCGQNSDVTPQEHFVVRESVKIDFTLLGAAVF